MFLVKQSIWLFIEYDAWSGAPGIYGSIKTLENKIKKKRGCLYWKIEKGVYILFWVKYVRIWFEEIYHWVKIKWKLLKKYKNLLSELGKAVLPYMGGEVEGHAIQFWTPQRLLSWTNPQLERGGHFENSP